MFDKVVRSRFQLLRNPNNFFYSRNKNCILFTRKKTNKKASCLVKSLSFPPRQLRHILMLPFRKEKRKGKSCLFRWLQKRNSNTYTKLNYCLSLLWRDLYLYTEKARLLCVIFETFSSQKLRNVFFK